MIGPNPAMKDGVSKWVESWMAFDDLRGNRCCWGEPGIRSGSSSVSKTATFTLDGLLDEARVDSWVRANVYVEGK